MLKRLGFALALAVVISPAASAEPIRLGLEFWLRSEITEIADFSEKTIAYKTGTERPASGPRTLSPWYILDRSCPGIGVKAGLAPSAAKMRYCPRSQAPS